MSLTVRVLVGLIGGFLLGLALASIPNAAALKPLMTGLSAVGAIFINLIRMTVIPLVVSMLIASLGAMAGSRALGRAGLQGIVLALALLTVAAALTLAIAYPVLMTLHVDPSSALQRSAKTSLSEAAPPGTGAVSSGFAEWLIALIPTNPIKAAADGTILPLIVFAVLFALALARADEARRAAVVRLVQGIADAMQRLVSGILALAPIGVFALAVPLAAQLGASALGAVAAYVALAVALMVLVGASVLYPVGILMGPLSGRGFAAYCAPAQAVAFASRTSLAALPAMIESAERAGFPPVVSGFMLPLAASLFRVGAVVAQTVGVLFLARLYGIVVGPTQLATVFLVVVLTSFTVPGIPFGSIIAMVPVLAAANVPIEGVGILLAVDTIPDMFRTTLNTTGSMTLAAVLAPQRHRRDG